ncbi:hypothetical protein [Synechococcus sp.]
MKIKTGTVYHEDRLTATPRAQWPALLRERRMYIETQFEYDCRCIVQYLDEAEEVYVELGYESADEMIQQELLIKPEWVRIAVTWLNQEERVEPVTKAEVEAALGSHGGDRRSAQAKQDQPDNISLKYGTDATYLLRRLARDAPDVLERVKTGEIKSARAAAIEAGIIKPVPTVRLVADMAVVAGKLRQHLTQQQLIELFDRLEPLLPRQ